MHKSFSTKVCSLLTDLFSKQLSTHKYPSLEGAIQDTNLLTDSLRQDFPCVLAGSTKGMKSAKCRIQSDSVLEVGVRQIRAQERDSPHSGPWQSLLILAWLPDQQDIQQKPITDGNGRHGVPG